MSNLTTETSNLNKHIIEPIKKNLGNKLAAYYYHDICEEDELTTNGNGVDIIAYQLELRFKGAIPIFISWTTIEGWSQYSLSVSETPFCNGAESFTKKDNNWTKIVGKALERFEVYGYKEMATLIEKVSGIITQEIYNYEPHLLVLQFDNNVVLGVANFYSEDDFIPRYPTGDDVWIIFGKSQIDIYIEKLSLEKFDVSTLFKK